ncbi:MAG: 23S rRNA (pseudouridine(1915)-N(3))-methyltransferase RlmH [Methanotrichaceae archaeon]|nr:23S rRNA (pseudouridine(1915)-N(3))-methyltransferase RlmH [Methanotrichaceae archaeon]MDD1758432.1 23S rRNA (pseudouridine(1915)-N(3))-methyltransferase RlmH [Methanotrichaceae archaeon]
MILRLIAVGKLRERYWKEGVSDYLQRLKPYAKLEILEVSEAKLPIRPSSNEEQKAKAKEAEAITEKINGLRGLIVALDRQGKVMDSLEFARWLESQMLKDQKEINWIIGGHLGLDSSIIRKANLSLSFSNLTFPHQMMRLILLEQIYRCFRIIHNEPYHK